jgi:glutathione S-transferase
MIILKINHLFHANVNHTLESNLSNLKRKEERSMYKLYYSPFACSLAVHIALEKIGTEFELETVDVRKGQHQTKKYAKLNKHGKVPLLQDGDQLIDQGAGILLYLAEKHPEANIMPATGTQNWGQALSALFYMSNTVHPAFSIAINPDRFTTGGTDVVLRKSMEKIEQLLAELNLQLVNQDFISGDKPYAADYYLAAMLNWLRLFKKKLDAYPNVKSYKARMNNLPEVSRAVGKEMEDLGFFISSMFKLFNYKKSLTRKITGKQNYA